MLQIGRTDMDALLQCWPIASLALGHPTDTWVLKFSAKTRKTKLKSGLAGLGERKSVILIWKRDPIIDQHIYQHPNRLGDPLFFRCWKETEMLCGGSAKISPTGNLSRDGGYPNNTHFTDVQTPFDLWKVCRNRNSTPHWSQLEASPFLKTSRWPL